MSVNAQVLRLKKQLEDAERKQRESEKVRSQNCVNGGKWSSQFSVKFGRFLRSITITAGRYSQASLSSLMAISLPKTC